MAGARTMHGGTQKARCHPDSLPAFPRVLVALLGSGGSPSLRVVLEGQVRQGLGSHPRQSSACGTGRRTATSPAQRGQLFLSWDRLQRQTRRWQEIRRKLWKEAEVGF